MAHIAVTGGYGFIGSHLVTTLLERGDTVTVVDVAKRTTDPGLDFDAHPGFRFVQADVTDLDALAQGLTADVDVVYHLSAVVGITHYVRDTLRTIDTTVIGTRNVLELARRHGFRVLLTSTSEVLGKNPTVPWREDDDRVLGSTRTARWSYSTSKALAEHMTFAMHDAYGVPASIVRYFNVYGPRQNPIFVVSRSVHKALNGEAPDLYDGGRATRCFTYVDDAVKGTILAAESPAALGQAFHVGSMTESSMREVVDLVVRHADPSGRLEVAPFDTAERYGSAYEDIPRRIPDATKAAEVLGWRAETTLDEGIRRTVAWARANPWYLAQPLSDPAAPAPVTPAAPDAAPR